MNIINKITVIIGSAGSGKTTAAKCIAKDYDSDKVVWIDGNNKRRNFLWNRCKENTELVIIEELKNIKDLELLFGPAIDGIAVEHQGKEEFYINPKIVVTCKSDVTIKDFPTHSRAFSRRTMIVDCDIPM
jgi:ABC-type oligopeptide transport system ATPase subunit